jgi:hypothetical protein
MDMDAAIWAAEAAAIIMGGAGAAGTITAGATIVITKILAVARHCPGGSGGFSDNNWPRLPDAAS